MNVDVKREVSNWCVWSKLWSWAYMHTYTLTYMQFMYTNKSEGRIHIYKRSLDCYGMSVCMCIWMEWQFTHKIKFRKKGYTHTYTQKRACSQSYMKNLKISTAYPFHCLSTAKFFIFVFLFLLLLLI